MKNKSFFCSRPFHCLDIYPDGRVYSCCPAWTDEYYLGNIFEQNFNEVWNGEKAKKFRASILDGSYCYCNKEKCILYLKNDFNLFSKFYDIEEATAKKFSEIMAPTKFVKFSHDRTCNVRCVICRDCQHTNSIEMTLKFDKMIGDIFLPMLENAEIVSLNGCGEALASRHCRNLIKATTKKYPEIKFALLSNGLLLDKNNFEELGVTDKIYSVYISLHSTNKDTYKKIVFDSNFDRVIKNIEELSHMKKQGLLAEIILAMVVSKINYKEMFSFAQLAEKYDTYAQFTEIIDWGTKNWFGAGSKSFEELEVFKEKHPEYNSFCKILQNDIFKSERCLLSPLFLKIKPVTGLQYFKNRFDAFYAKRKYK
jgi:radical SAM protein with 4Fe4S-binding SPASM domain